MAHKINKLLKEVEVFTEILNMIPSTTLSDQEKHVILDELKLMENAGETGAYLNAAMADALGDHAHVGEVRGEGMLCAVEFVKARDGRVYFEASEKIGPQIAGALLAEGVIARAMPQGDILGFAPPFCLTRQEADEVVGKTAKAVKSVLG